MIASALIAIAAVAAVLVGAGSRSAYAASPDANFCVMRAVFVQPDDDLYTLAHESKWDSDSWVWYPPDRVSTIQEQWGEAGGLFRGCHNEVKYRVACKGFACVIPSNEPPYTRNIHNEALATVEISETLPWSGSQSADCVIDSVGDFRFPGRHCIVTESRVDPRGTLGARELNAAVSVYLGPLCIRDLSVKRPVELCL